MLYYSQIGSEGTRSDLESAEPFRVCLMTSGLIFSVAFIWLFSCHDSFANSFRWPFVGVLITLFFPRRVAGEPALGEWTSRAELCDTLHEPVGFKHFSHFIFFAEEFQTFLRVYAVYHSPSVCF